MIERNSKVLRWFQVLVLMGTGKASHDDGIGVSYVAQSVVRSYHEEFAVWKVPSTFRRTGLLSLS